MMRTCPLVLLATSAAVLVAVAAGPAALASPPLLPGVTHRGPVPDEPAFVPEAGYKEVVQKLFEGRRKAESNHDDENSASLRLVKRVQVPVVLFRFADTPTDPAPYPAYSYQVRLFGDPADPDNDRKATFTNFFRDMSNGDFIPGGKVYDWITLSGNADEYATDVTGMIREVLKKADEAIDFGLYDNDGTDRRPNSGDDDGLVDAVILVHPQISYQKGGVFNSHTGNYSRRQGAGGRSFATKTRRKLSAFAVAAAGAAAAYAAGAAASAATGAAAVASASAAAGAAPEFVRINDYILVEGLSGDQPADAGASRRIAEIGVFCHEFCHALGLPDLYDRTPRDIPDSAGVGTYCVLGHGAYGGDRKHPERPVSLSAWGKYFLGWAHVTTLASSRGYTFKPVQEANEIYRIAVDGTLDKEYFLIEFRKNDGVGAEFNKVNWDKDLPASGLLVWHIDERVGSGDSAGPGRWPFASFCHGQNDNRSLPEGQPIHYPAEHALVALVQADGKLDLEQNVNYPDHGDFFVTGDLGDDASLAKCLRGYNGKYTGLRVTQIDLSAMRFQLIRAGEEGTAAAPPSVSPVGLAVLRKLRDIERLLAANPGATPDDARPADLAGIPITTIRTRGRLELQPRLLELSRASRTRSLGAAIRPAPGAEATVSGLLRRWKVAGPATVRFAPARAPGGAFDRVERIEGLAIDPAGRPMKPFLTGIVADLPDVLGLGVELVPRPSNAYSPGVGQQFAQVVRVDGHPLPLLGRGDQLDFHGAEVYTDPQGRITTMILDVIPPDLLPALDGTVKTTENQVRANVPIYTNRPLGAIEPEIVQGVYLTNNDPSTASVVYRIRVPGTANAATVDVYVDAATAQIKDLQ